MSVNDATTFYRKVIFGRAMIVIFCGEDECVAKENRVEINKIEV